MDNHSLAENDFYTEEIQRWLKELRSTHVGQILIDRIQFQLDELMKKFDRSRINQTYDDRVSSIQGGRKELMKLKNWLLQQ